MLNTANTAASSGISGVSGESHLLGGAGSFNLGQKAFQITKMDDKKSSIVGGVRTLQRIDITDKYNQVQEEDQIEDEEEDDEEEDEDETSPEAHEDENDPEKQGLSKSYRKI